MSIIHILVATTKESVVREQSKGSKARLLLILNRLDALDAVIVPASQEFDEVVVLGTESRARMSSFCFRYNNLDSWNIVMMN